MPVFYYKAKKKNAEAIEGQISAQTKDEAVELISSMGLLPVLVSEEKPFQLSAKQVDFGRVGIKELYQFSRQLGNLLKAGVSILRALQILSEQTTNAYFKYLLWKIHQGIRDGRTFSDCLGDFPRVFSPLFVTMMAAGEESGNLKEMLSRMAEYLRIQAEVSSKIRNAMAYPLFMLGVGLLTVLFMLTFVMPQLSGLFDSLGQQLPVPTKIVLSVSHALRQWWYIFAPVVVVLGFLYRQWSRSRAGRIALSNLRLSLPLLGEFTLKAELGRFCRTLGLLLESGIPLLKSMQVAIPILENEQMKVELNKCRDALSGGATFGSSLKELENIPPVVVNLVTVGEESGALGRTLEDIADSYEQETGEMLKTAMTLVEPVMILAVGLVVGFIVIAMLLPVFQMDILAQ